MKALDGAMAPLASSSVSLYPKIGGVRPSLRRADWTFLLTASRRGKIPHLVLLGGDERDAEATASADVARRVSFTIPSSPEASVIGVFHGAPVEPEIVAAALVPGGTVYWEVTNAAPGRSLRALRRALRAAGLEEEGVYWVRGSGSYRSAFVPLHSPEALRWYYTTLSPRSNRTTAILRKLPPEAYRVLCRLKASRAPCTAIVATKPDIATPAAQPSADSGPERTPVAATLMLAGGKDDRCRIVLLPFSPGRTEPAEIQKFSRAADLAVDIRHEQEVLESVRRCLDASMVDTVPTPLGIYSTGSSAFGRESFIPGRPISTGRDQTDSSTDFIAVVNWLTTFNLQAQAGAILWERAEQESWVTQPLNDYRAVFGVSAAEAAMFDYVAKCSERLTGCRLPHVWAHGDLLPSNIVRTANGIGVIDWACGRISLPLFDLLYFSLHWALEKQGPTTPAERVQLFQRFFSRAERDNSWSARVAKSIDSYLRSMAIDREFLPILVVSFLTLHAVQIGTWNATAGQASTQPGQLYAELLKGIATDRSIH